MKETVDGDERNVIRSVDSTSGKVIFGGLPIGTYYVKKEVSGGANYYTNPNFYEIEVTTKDVQDGCASTVKAADHQVGSAEGTITNVEKQQELLRKFGRITPIRMVSDQKL